MATIEEETEKRRELVEVMLDEIRTGKKGIDAKIALYLEETRLGVSFKETGKAVTTFAGGLKDSAKALAGSTGDFNDLSGVVTGTAAAVGGLLSIVPIFGDALSATSKAMGDATTFAFGQVQANFQTFQDLAMAGQIGADGITGMSKQMLATGMPLKTYSKLLIESSENLSLLSSSALAGGKSFSKTMTTMAGATGKPLRRLGLSVSDIGKTVVDFQVMQRRQGMLDSLSQDQIKQGTIAYAKELDLIAKLTGKTREGIQKEQEALMSDSRFRASIAGMTAEVQAEHRKALMQISDPEMQRAYMDKVSGFTNSAAAITYEINGMGGAIGDAIKSINEGGNATESVNILRKQALEITKVGMPLQVLSTIVESGTSVLGKYAPIADFAIGALKDEAEVVEAQTKVMSNVNVKAETLIDSMIDFQNSTAKINALFIATPAATAAIGLFTDTLTTSVNAIIDLINGKSKPKIGQGFNDMIGVTAEESKAKQDKLRSDQLAQVRAQADRQKNRFNKKPTTQPEVVVAAAPKTVPTPDTTKPKEQPSAPPTTAKEVAAAIEPKKEKPKSLADIYGDVSQDDIDAQTKKHKVEQNRLDQFSTIAGVGGLSDQEKEIQADMRAALREIAITLGEMKKVNKDQLAAQQIAAKNSG